MAQNATTVSIKLASTIFTIVLSACTVELALESMLLCEQLCSGSLSREGDSKQVCKALQANKLGSSIEPRRGRGDDVFTLAV
jgi:hypothetical protein